VLIVVFDTLRKDHVGTFGYERDTTPTIDSIAREGLVFDNAIAQSSWTRPSVASLFTSKYHSYFHPDFYLKDHGTSSLSNRFSDEALTLAEIFSSNGYRTSSITTNINFHEAFNLIQGFDENLYKKSGSADWVVDRAIETIESKGADDPRPLFLYLHFMEPHAPLDPPEKYASMFPTLDGKPHEDTHSRTFFFSNYSTKKSLRSSEFKNYRSHVLALYDGSIRFGDDEIGRLVGHLQKLNLWDQTVFAFLSDHGEALWDRPLLERRHRLHSFLLRDLYGVGHGHTLFPELIEVPLVLRGPGVPVARVAAQVRLIDVAPTLVSLAGVSHPNFEPTGSDLVAASRIGDHSNRLALSETSTSWGVQRSIQDSEFQLVRLDDDRELLFDRRNGGFSEISGTRNPGILARLREQLDAETSVRRSDTGELKESQGPETLEPSICRELAHLGYVELDSCPTED
jgi:arylsulfatase A-like enzyme